MNAVKGVGAGSSGLVLLGAVFGVVIASVQQWVYVELPVIESGQFVNYCTGPYIGTIGLYHSTFDPACVANSGASDTTKAFFAQFSRVESATTDFWPLFPTQTAFGGFFGTQVPAFDGNCTSYYAAGSALQTYLSVAAPVIANSALYAQATVPLTVGLATFQAELALGNAFFSSTWANVTQDSFTKIGSLLNLTQGVASFTANAYATTCATTGAGSCGLSNTSVSLLFATFSGTTSTTFLTGLFNCTGAGVTSILGCLLNGPFSGATLGAKFNATLLSAASNSTSAAILYGALQNPTYYASVQGVLNMIGGAALASSNTLLFDVVGSNSIMFPSFLKYYQLVGTIASVTPGPTASTTSLYAQMALFKACTLLGATTDAGCAAGYNGIPFADDFTAPSALCTLLVGNFSASNTSLGINSYNFNYTTGCSDLILVTTYGDALKSLVPSGNAVAAQLAGAIPLIGQKMYSCALGGYNLTQCLNLLSPVFPSDYTSPNYPLCLAAAINTTNTSVAQSLLANCNSFAQFASLPGGPLESTFGQCVKNGITSNSTCFSVLSTELLLGAFVNSTDSATEAESCASTQEDARRIQLAQKLVPAGIAMALLGLFAGLGFVVMTKAPVAALGGILSVAGGVLMLVALLQVKGAPVYQKVGLPPVNEKPLYVNGPAQTMGYLAIFLPILGGLGLIAGAVMAVMGVGASSGEAASTEVAAKVENEA